jgi:hypothetical protein
MAARSLWNTAFWPDPAFRDWGSVARFQEIARLLFDELVLMKLDIEWPTEDIFRKPIPLLRLEPNSPCGCPILIQSGDPERMGCWDDPVNRVNPNEAELQFLEFSDWNSRDYIDLKYYRVKVASFCPQPQVVGREALIERQYVKVHLAAST